MEEDKIVDNIDNVYGIIYIIKNHINNKIYIGQTVSHRKNHNRYRPFGHNGRLKDHISEALCNTKKNQCTYLNHAIRKHGKDMFYSELVEKCPKELMNEREMYYISYYNSLYPNGYNLTIGGKNMYVTKIKKDVDTLSITIKKNHEESTKHKISKGIKEYYETYPDKKLELSNRVKKQHYQNKVSIGLQYNIDENNLDQYISIRQKSIVIMFERKRDGKKAYFYQSLNESIHETINRAKAYLIDIIQQRNISLQHHQIAGNP